jgi:hypothetical protein
VRKISHLAFVTAVALTGCTDVLEGYVEAPAIATYFQSLVPAAELGGVTEIAVCRDGEEAHDAWHATVQFSDGNIYDYSLTKDNAEVLPGFMSTASQRKLAQRLIDIDYGCLRYIASRGPTIIPVRRAHGTYQFQVEKQRIVGFVPQKLAVNVSFDASDQARLRGAAMAVRAALKRQKEFKSIESSWGIKLDDPASPRP